MNQRVKIVLAMLGVAAVVWSVVYVISHNLRWAFGLSGVTLLADLIMMPKLLPHLFNKDT